MAKTDSTRGAPAPGTTIASAITLLSASLGMSAEAAPPTDGPTIHATDSAQHKRQTLETAEGDVDSVQHKHDSLQHKLDSVQHKFKSDQHKHDSLQHKTESRQHKLDSVQHKFKSDQHKLDSQQIKLKTVQPGQ